MAQQQVLSPPVTPPARGPIAVLRGIYPGWWIVLTGVLSLTVSSASGSYVLSVLVAPMEAELGWSRATIYGAMSVGSIVGSVVAGITGPLFDRYGARTMMTVGSIMSGVGVLLVAFASEPWQYYFLTGIVGGATRSFSNLGPRTAIANWFIKKRASAYATFTVGAPMSGVVFVPPVSALLPLTGWRSVWLFMGLLKIVVVAPMSWIFMRARRPEDIGLLPDGEPVTDDPNGEPQAERKPIAVREQPEDRWTSGAALRTPAFWLVALGFTCTMYAGSGMFPHLVPQGLDMGFSPAAAAFLLTSYSVGCVVARVVWPMVVTRQGIRRAMIAFAGSYALVIGSYVLARDIWTMYALIFLVGVVAGGTMPLQGQVWADYYGRNIVGAITGYASLVMMPSTTFSAFSGAVAHDLTGSYTVTFTAMSLLSVLAAIFFFLARKPAPPPAPASAEPRLAARIAIAR